MTIKKIIIYSLLALFFIGLTSSMLAGRPQKDQAGEPLADTCIGADLQDRIKKSQDAAARKDHESVVLWLGRCHKQIADGSYEHELLSNASNAIEKKQAAEKKRQLGEWKKEGVTLGMTQERVLQSNWGKPRKINTTTTQLGTREQWVYGGSYLYFENGILTTIQN